MSPRSSIILSVPAGADQNQVIVALTGFTVETVRPHYHNVIHVLILSQQFTAERMQSFREVTADAVNVYCQSSSEQCGEVFSRKKHLLERYNYIY